MCSDHIGTSTANGNFAFIATARTARVSRVGFQQGIFSSCRARHITRRTTTLRSTSHAIMIMVVRRCVVRRHVKRNLLFHIRWSKSNTPCARHRTMRSVAFLKCSPSISEATHLRPSCSAAMQVVPLPANGSHTKSVATLVKSISFLMSLIGFSCG